MTFMPPPVAEQTGSPLAPRKVSFSEAVARFYGNYSNLSGRASRSEYWFATLYTSIVGLPLNMLAWSTGTVDPDTGVPSPNPMWMAIAGLWFLAHLVPTIAVLWRRLHDVNRSGGYYFWAFIPFGAIFVLVRLCSQGDPQENRFGPAA
jgi:uncharacterized membrane protein YhaH (DUF805 family)